MIRTDEHGLWLVLTETISAHSEEVLASFTTAGGIQRWLSVDAEIDARPGGELVLYWTKDRNKKTTRRIIDLDPSGSITWQWFARRADHEISLRWSVEPDVERGAKVSLEAGPFPAALEFVEAMVDEAVTWTWHLCNLRSALEVGFDMRVHRPL